MIPAGDSQLGEQCNTDKTHSHRGLLLSSILKLMNLFKQKSAFIFLHLELNSCSE